MNYYFDFDNTLYETANLTKAMLDKIATIVSSKTGKNKEEVLETVKSTFDSSNDNIYTHAEKIASKYGIDTKETVQGVRDVVDNGDVFVFEDAKRFLEKVKADGNKIHVLTFLPKTNQEYQLQKISGSGLAKYFDVMILTTEPKHTLELNYENGIFFDDNPKDLEGLNSMNPLRLIRIRKPNNKRSVIEMDLENMEEYVSFDDISLDFKK